MTEESLKRQSISRKKFYKECLAYYEQLKAGEIGIDLIPTKYHKKIESFLNANP